MITARVTATRSSRAEPVPVKYSSTPHAAIKAETREYGFGDGI